jgi:hypothetical protein
MAMSRLPATTGVSAALGIEDLDVEPFLLEESLAEREFDERAVPEAALGDRDPQGLGRCAVRHHGRDHADEDGDGRAHGVSCPLVSGRIGSEHGKRIPGGAKRNGASYSLPPMTHDSV